MAAPKTYIKSKFPYVMTHLNIFRRPSVKKVLYRKPWGLAGWVWWQALLIACKDSHQSGTGRIHIGDDPITREDLDSIDCWEPPTVEFVDHLIKQGWMREDESGCLVIVNPEPWLATPSTTPEYDAARKSANPKNKPENENFPEDLRNDSAETPDNLRTPSAETPDPKPIQGKASRAKPIKDQVNISQAKQITPGGDPPDPQGQALDIATGDGGTQDKLFALQCEWTTRHIPPAAPPQLAEGDLLRWIAERQKTESPRERDATQEKILAFRTEFLGQPTRLGVVRYTDLVSALEMAWQAVEHRKRQVGAKPIRNMLRLAVSIAKDHLADAVEWRTDRQYAFERQHQHLMLWEFEAEAEYANA